MPILYNQVNICYKKFLIYLTLLSDAFEKVIENLLYSQVFHMKFYNNLILAKERKNFLIHKYYAVKYIEKVSGYQFLCDKWRYFQQLQI